jgi:hypothetical protein
LTRVQLGLEKWDFVLVVSRQQLQQQQQLVDAYD